VKARGRSGIAWDATVGAARAVAELGIPKCDGFTVLEVLGIETFGNPRFSCADGGRLDLCGDLVLLLVDLRRSSLTSTSCTLVEDSAGYALSS
jgi:hypothetical protein